MRRRVAVLQSNYLPWKGYFDLMHDVDLFVFYDDVQYSKHNWRNRNLIKTPAGPAWLTVPVGPDQHRLICEVTIEDDRWQAQHWRRLVQHYAAAPHFARYHDYFAELYRRPWTNLSQLNQTLVADIAGWLGIRTELQDSRQYRLPGRKLDRLLELLRRVGATSYVSGPAGRSYIDAQRFEEAGIELSWKDYSDYPEYPQFHPPFVHQVTVLDLLFHSGPHAPFFIWAHRQQPACA